MALRSSGDHTPLKTRKLTLNGETYEVPEGWSDPACLIFAEKYAREVKGKFKETKFLDVFLRLVSFWFPDDRDLQKQLLVDLWNQFASPNSPQYFNAGIHSSYGFTGGNIGLCAFSKSGEIVNCSTTFLHPQLHACFIQPVADSRESIYQLIDSESRLFSRGSGTGTNFSDLRGEGEPMRGGGTSSGLISFLRIFDVSAGAIKSGGTTRRAAKMVVLDVDHPDILSFVEWKVGEEMKARTLINAGYEDHWEGEAYQTVGGQNSNNSVRIPDSFMAAVKDDGPWDLVNRVDGRKHRISAKYLWDRICYAAWFCADPGVQFSDTINRWNTTPNSGEIRASNPCSEHLRLDNSACNLASINLTSLLLEDGRFDTESFCRLVRRWVCVLDRSIDIAGYPTRSIAHGAYRYRDIGLGYCGLGALLMRMGIPYDSEKGRAYAALIAAVMNAVAYDQSVELAKEHGAYPAYDDNQAEHRQILDMHISALASISETEAVLEDECLSDMWGTARGFYALAEDEVKAHGIRNAQLTVIAPTGTIGITMECETTGIEPVYDRTVIKTLAGGGKLITASDSFTIAQRRLGIEIGATPPDKQREAVQNPVFATAVDEVHGNFLSPDAHVDMVSAVQPHISGGISKTVNLPKDVTVSDISRIYTKAFDAGVKCISVYRDGCKSQPLTADCKKCGDEEACEIE